MVLWQHSVFMTHRPALTCWLEIHLPKHPFSRVVGERAVFHLGFYLFSLLLSILPSLHEIRKLGVTNMQDSKLNSLTGQELKQIKLLLLKQKSAILPQPVRGSHSVMATTGIETQSYITMSFVTSEHSFFWPINLIIYSVKNSTSYINQVCTFCPQKLTSKL